MALLKSARTDLPEEHRCSSRRIAVESPSKGEEPQRDAEFIALLGAYRPAGGLLRSDDLADLLIARRCGDHGSLARSIVSGELLCFDWDRTAWVPAFQLNRDSLAAGTPTRRVLAELSRSFDGWSAAHWFVAANAWLRDLRPDRIVGSGV